LSIANGDKRVEREPTSTFHDLGNTVDGDDVLDEIAPTFALVATVARAPALAAAFLPALSATRRATAVPAAAITTTSLAAATLTTAATTPATFSTRLIRACTRLCGRYRCWCCLFFLFSLSH
jgi:hypothetical protein